MQWLEKHINSFFNLNVIISTFGAISVIWITIMFIGIGCGIPHFFPFGWTVAQRESINSFAPIGIVSAIIYLLFSAWFFLKNFFAFPVFIFYRIINLQLSGKENYIQYLSQLVTQNQLSVAFNIGWFLDGFQFVLCVIGTILWIRKLTKS